jgi:hypothetical protein
MHGGLIANFVHSVLKIDIYYNNTNKYTRIFYNFKKTGLALSLKSCLILKKRKKEDNNTYYNLNFTFFIRDHLDIIFQLRAPLFPTMP